MITKRIPATMSHGSPVNIQRKVSEILADPTVSYWLKASIESSMKRDRVDAVIDAEALASLLRTIYEVEKIENAG